MLLLVFIFVVITAPLFSQNYVVNGGFERTPPAARGAAPPCAFSGGADVLNNYVQGWQTFKNMTPDVLVADSASVCNLLPRPRRGARMVGLIMYHPHSDGKNDADYHELIQGSLAQPLQKGKTYRVRFWVRTDDSLGVRHLSGVFGQTKNIMPVRCGNFGFHFSTNKININENFMESQTIFAVQPQLNREELLETPDGNWRQVIFLFKADQPYRYFLFGNFFFDAVTKTNLAEAQRARIDSINRATELWPQKIKRIAYYCFDDFVVEEFSGDEFSRTLLEQKKLRFDSEILFDHDEATLRPDAQHILQKLANALNGLPEMPVEIGGHTDNTGDAAYNQALSERRARAVYDFLLENGATPTRFSWRGYGENQPVDTNDTEAGRQKNRRVEIKVD
ncbi:MAG: OmpA family protein [Thermoanaerobaculia bacterium]|nr:OmpA family protein [Thermoanaerobaculia bacterium]